jgi:hypothetical protein
MSHQIGMDCINLRPTPRLAHTEYCSNDALRRYLQSQGRLEDVWNCDLNWCVNDGEVDWGLRGRQTDMGHADFLEGGVDRRQPKECPFKTPDEVWAFDAVKEYGLPDFDGLVSYYQKWHDQAQRDNPNQVVTGGYYKTIVSGAIQAFGWDILLEAAADQDAFEKVLDSFFRLTLHHM